MFEESGAGQLLELGADEELQFSEEFPFYAPSSSSNFIVLETFRFGRILHPVFVFKDVLRLR